MKAEKTFTHAGQTIEIHQDDDPQSPQEYGDNGLFLVANHRDFFIPPSKNERSWDWDELVIKHKDTHWVFPLEAYIHSGVVLALRNEGNFPDRQWDVSQLGIVFVSKKEWRLSKSARKAALSLIKTWNDYLSGDVWGYVVNPDEDGDSCWGFYGFEYCIAQAKSIAEHIQARKLKEQLGKVKAWITNRVPLDKRHLPAVV